MAAVTPVEVPERQWHEQKDYESAGKKGLFEFLKAYVTQDVLEANKLGAAVTSFKNRKLPAMIALYERVYDEAPALWKTEEEAAAAIEAAAAAEEAAAAAAAEKAEKAAAAREARQAKLAEMEAERNSSRVKGGKNATSTGGSVRQRGRQGGKVKPLRQKKGKAKQYTEEDLEHLQRKKDEAAKLKAARNALAKKKKK